MAVNKYKLILRFLSNDSPFENALRVLGSDIRDSNKMLEGLGGGEMDEAFVDELCDQTEQLLGLAFVAGQAQVTRVVSAVVAVRRIAKAEKPSVLLDTTGASREAIVKFGGVDGRPSVAQAIDALANYYKHEAEWAGDWSRLKGPAAKTASTVKLIGLEQNNSGNLRTGFEWLFGHEKYWQLGDVAVAVDRWREGLTQSYTAELERRRLI